MRLSKDEVLHIAKLSRLQLNEEEVERFQGQLSDVLEYVEKLNAVDTDGVEETSQVTGLINVYRTDKINPSGIETELVNQAPDSDDNQVKVPNVF